MSYTFGDKPLTGDDTAEQAAKSQAIREIEQGTERGPQAKVTAETSAKRAIPEKFEKHKEKTLFPPGLVVSEKAKAKMAEQQEKIRKKQLEKAEKRAEQLQRWQNRPGILKKWEEWEAHQQAVRDKILAKWDEQDKKRAEKVAAKLEKLADDPVKLEKEKKKIAEEDAKERLKRAKYMDHIEAKQLKALKKREHAQIRRDKMHNFFGKFLGWEKREIPVIPQATLNDWALEGFEDLGAVDTKMSLLLLLGLAFLLLRAKPQEVVTASRKRGKKRRKR